MTDLKDRREHPRFHVGECGYIELRVGADAICRHEVYIADISRGGLGLYLECPLAVDTPVRITLSKCTVDGSVAHCREEETGFIAGIRAHKLIERVDDLRAHDPSALQADAATMRN